MKIECNKNGDNNNNNNKGATGMSTLNYKGDWYLLSGKFTNDSNFYVQTSASKHVRRASFFTRFPSVCRGCYSVSASSVAIVLVSSDERQTKYSREQCTSDDPKTVVKKRSNIECAAACNICPRCREYNYEETTKDSRLYQHIPLLQGVP